MKRIPQRLLGLSAAVVILVQNSPTSPPARRLPPRSVLPATHPPGTKGGPMVYVSDFKFYLDQYEVTNQDFRDCAAAGVCVIVKQKMTLDAPRQPAVYITQEDARTYCRWAGKRLPTQREWQEAAQGTDGRLYPWGNQEPDCRLANFSGCAPGTLPKGSLPEGASPYGALDMAGNVWEWVEEAGTGCGGGWHNAPALVRVTFCDQFKTTSRTNAGGIRCARDGSP